MFCPISFNNSSHLVSIINFEGSYNFTVHNTSLKRDYPSFVLSNVDRFYEGISHQLHVALHSSLKINVEKLVFMYFRKKKKNYMFYIVMFT